MLELSIFLVVNLINPTTTNPLPYQELKDHGFGKIISEDKFSSLSSDLITACFNKDMKETAGPFCSGSSTSRNAVSDWIQKFHLYSITT